MRQAKEALMIKPIQEIRAMLSGLGAPMASRSKEELVDRYIALIDTREAQIAKAEEPMKVIQPMKVLTDNESPYKRHESIKQLLSEHIRKGLTLTFTSETTWKMQRGPIIDSGHISVPDQIIIRCADAVLRG